MTAVHPRVYYFSGGASLFVSVFSQISCKDCKLWLQGSVSVSMRLHQTSFCFICAHLTAGDKKGDEERRNWDAKEILKRTHFPRNKDATTNNLRNIWGHE